uniref:Candidate secreted effector n=1 Tax=Meloidogyne incognita TaxID=6306 RepID=A0A914KWD3_MELIC
MTKNSWNSKCSRIFNFNSTNFYRQISNSERLKFFFFWAIRKKAPIFFKMGDSKSGDRPSFCATCTSIQKN